MKKNYGFLGALFVAALIFLIFVQGNREGLKTITPSGFIPEKNLYSDSEWDFLEYFTRDTWTLKRVINGVCFFEDSDFHNDGIIIIKGAVISNDGDVMVSYGNENYILLISEKKKKAGFFPFTGDMPTYFDFTDLKSTNKSKNIEDHPELQLFIKYDRMWFNVIPLKRIKYPRWQMLSGVSFFVLIVWQCVNNNYSVENQKQIKLLLMQEGDILWDR